jgi:hypothetical protein
MLSPNANNVECGNWSSPPAWARTTGRFNASRSFTVFGFGTTVVGGEVVDGDVVMAVAVVDDVLAAWVVVVAAVVAGRAVVVMVTVVTDAVGVDDELQLATVKEAASMTGRHRRKTMALRLGRNPQTREVGPVA